MLRISTLRWPATGPYRTTTTGPASHTQLTSISQWGQCYKNWKFEILQSFIFYFIRSHSIPRWSLPPKNSQNFNVPVQIYKLDPFLDFFGRLPCSIYWKLFKRIWQKTKLLDFHVQWFIYSHRGNIRISEWQRVHVTKQNTLLFTNSVSAIKDFPTNIRPLLCQLEICFEPGSSEKGVLNMRFCLIWSSQTRVNSEGRLRRLEYFSEEPRPGHGLDLWCWTGVTALAAALLSGEAELQPLNR